VNHQSPLTTTSLPPNCGTRCTRSSRWSPSAPSTKPSWSQSMRLPSMPRMVVTVQNSAGNQTKDYFNKTLSWMQDQEKRRWRNLRSIIGAATPPAGSGTLDTSYCASYCHTVLLSYWHRLSYRAFYCVGHPMSYHLWWQGDASHTTPCPHVIPISSHTVVLVAT